MASRVRIATYSSEGSRFLGDGARLLPFTEDLSRSLRDMAFLLVPRVCDDARALEALQRR